MQKLEFGLTRSGINHCAMEIVCSDKRDHSFTNKGLCGHVFMKNHPDLSFRVPQALSEAHAQRGNLIIINDYFKKLQIIIQEHSLTADCIWNMDETGFALSPKIQKVLSKKGARQVHKISHGNVNDHISVAPTILAAGEYVPPLIIYKCIHMIPGLLTGAPAGSVMGFTDSGYMKENLFQMYINHFINLIPPVCPVLLIFDGHKSHVNYLSVNFCHENGILLFTLPPHTTHILQPSEIPFAKLKKEYSKRCDELYSSSGELVTKRTFAKVLGKAFNTTYTPTAITNAYKATGIWPFNPTAIITEQPQEIDDIPLETDEEAPEIDEEAPETEEETPETVDEISQPTHTYSTRASIVEKMELLEEKIVTLKEENKSLKDEILLLKRSNSSIQEELQTFKSPGTCPLKLVLKYPTPRLPQFTNELKTSDGDALVRPQKRRKTLPFAQLITNEESLQALRETEELAQQKKEAAQRKKEEAQRKKEEAQRKRTERELEKTKTK
ncbi:4710_t:CDS:2 [Diversispora eburnea]|uniref:4710_t:CDS:1 n=1 Tax=Diversispora eburnea TaxID=1213867 RepID=A0A9N8UVR2_9GLOM|nr:4710_t:CDS:2 [Diversispora eburnea]